MATLCRWLALVASLSSVSLGCNDDEAPDRYPASASAAGSTTGTGQITLFGAPLIFATTSHGFGVHAVVANGAPEELRASVRELGTATWSANAVAASTAGDVVRFALEGLRPGTAYEYRLTEQHAEHAPALFSGLVTTRREPGSSFSFVLITDTHIAPREVLPGATDTADFAEDTLLETAHAFGQDRPDFVLNLGDVLDFHLFGFNDPPPDSSWTRLAYLNYRRLWGDVLGNTTHFRVIGNWDGENGCNTQEEIERSRSARLLYVPGPSPETYPEGGSPNQDYYAFSWGDAVFVALNVMTYTPTPHLLGINPGLPDDWTLGAEQLAWLEETLANTRSRWRFLFIHHTVGGAAGDEIDSAYGRGGGQAAHVGEQARVHELMLRYGVQVFFFGHDHVFVDTVVDGVHYTLPGSAGAPWKFTADETGYSKFWPDSGYGRVRVGPESVGVEFVGLDQRVLYSYRLD